MGKKNKSPEQIIAFSIDLPIYQSVINGFLEQISDVLSTQDIEASAEYISQKPEVIKYLESFITDILHESLADNYFYMDQPRIFKMFAAEIKAKKETLKQERELEEAEEKAARKANAKEEARLRKEGRTFAVSLEDANTAEAILRAAGINIKLLP